MMEKEQLRKADIFSGAVILILGLFIISQAVKMPMKDSWGGVQNVWFVSPALFPLFVGSMLSLLGGILVSFALKSVGKDGLRAVFAYFGSSDFTAFLRQPLTIRYYAVVLTLLVFVFLMVPRVDFFLAATMFLLTLFFLYYIGDHDHLLKILGYTIVAGLVLLVFSLSDLHSRLSGLTEFSSDWLVIILLIGLILMAWASVKSAPEFKKKYRLCLLVGVIAPLTIGIIFKYFLLVPMPYEGLVVQLLDGIWYAEIWQ